MKTRAQVPRCVSCPARAKGVASSLTGASLLKFDRGKFSREYDRGQAIFYEGNPEYLLRGDAELAFRFLAKLAKELRISEDELAARKILELDRRSITVVNRPALRRAASEPGVPHRE